jgi:hypothetical protein
VSQQGLNAYGAVTGPVFLCTRVHEVLWLDAHLQPSRLMDEYLETIEKKDGKFFL